MPQDTVKSPTLSPQHAFVVQFHADTQIKAGQVTGHVEHVVSGKLSHSSPSRPC